VNGIRYFAIGDDFTSMGIHYTATPGDILVNFVVLIVFAILMFALAWWRFQKAVVT
jgi:ABC-2 type transport system permease protein